MKLKLSGLNFMLLKKLQTQETDEDFEQLYEPEISEESLMTESYDYDDDDDVTFEDFA